MRPFVRSLKASLVGILLLGAVSGMHSFRGGEPANATSYPFPDLVVDDLISRNQFGGDCTVPAGVDVVVRNIGKDTAAASVTRLVMDGFYSEDLSTRAIAAGQSVTVHSYNLPYTSGTHSFTGTADFSQMVVELDEDNNSQTETFSVTTLPTCTPSPTATPVGTPPAVGGIAQLPRPDAAAEAASEGRSSSMRPVIWIPFAFGGLPLVLLWRTLRRRGR